ncbi:heptaprenylglyceryl phosphate synthase [Lysinibacillus sp. fkY74-1]|uniref:Heptaprenylglyceryl phosphate synthase n=2 Tax=Lysinibacillus TaxID=400634 RepID=W7RJQ4_LYSSH|nr:MULTISPECIES: heptaprenylglyceryl phosphate synthase [Lysinibacillus]MBE5085852.1 heptaprenylglyceryl phosphate synthase [Bacillus thuringiensis]AMO32052.1 geranylgeranylglyceryl/heptaprenylglyceryl phosphate synthase [Lysinibacillus sphaericus]AMR88829.1 geranylgeranylglyceryl/heptaprenylglyceryl phosphate synthase [Lysinibacillus sphaericus]ANA46900.1 geranylgeranylglyceryl/heptaprenylglyceryl phosphate synthase [Lysinibacillus sphaericus]EWH30704.1 geranylgeranylglyceryl phosphate syntha
MDYLEWRHVFKLDPAKDISDEDLEKICESGTDVILVGGTDNVTLDGVLDLLVRVRRFEVPIALEISTIDAITPGYDYYFIPTVLNSDDPKWIKNLHHAAIKEFGDIMVWDELVAEGYCILNPDCKVAHVTGATTDLSIDDIVAYARMAENFFKLPVFYLEYSGIYGNPEVVSAVKNELKHTKLFYGGGITSAKQAEEMAQYADTVVVGNIIYEDLKAALATVKAVKNTL